MNHKRYAGIELGGTKTICLVGKSFDVIEGEIQFATTTPQQTFAQAFDFLKSFDDLASIGVGAFGPVNINAASPDYGMIEATPKTGWSHINVRHILQQEFSCAIHIDTDVNVAALAEYHEGNGKGLNSFIYLTVGTGIGGGALINGTPVHGLSHPEMGHIALPRVKGDEEFESACPFHSNCVEGLASGTAIRKRWGKPLNELPEDHSAWEYEAEYLAELFHSLTLVYSPQKIICGGGVSSEPLLQRARAKLGQKLNGYVSTLSDPSRLTSYICVPALGNQAGPGGSFILAQSKT